MADDKSLRLWVEDQLYALLGDTHASCPATFSGRPAGHTPSPLAVPALAGFAERALVDFCISLAKKTPNVAKLADTLQAQGLPPSSDTRRFAGDLLSRLPRAGAAGSVSAYKAAERAAAETARKNQSYALLVDDDDDEEQPAAAPEPADGKKKSHRRSRRDSVAGDADDDTVVKRASRKRAWEEDEEEDAAAAEARRQAEARERDRAEKEEFEQRLRERDEAKTRKLAERHVPKEVLEDLERRKKAEAAEDRAGVISDMRKFSRQEYLKKREEAKLEELKEALEDEKYLFAGQRLTEKEARDLAYKEEVYRLAVERKKQLGE